MSARSLHTAAEFRRRIVVGALGLSAATVLFISIYLIALLDLEGVECTGLDELATALNQEVDGEPPKVVILEKLEHLVMRVQGGSDLLERTTSFMSHTSSSVVWP